MNVLFHGDGDSHRGLGHLVRSLALALETNARQKKIKAFFATSNPQAAQGVLREMSIFFSANVKVIELQDRVPSSWTDAADKISRQLAEVIQKEKISVIVSDGKYPWSKSQLERLGSNSILIDNIEAAREGGCLLIVAADNLGPEFDARKGKDVFTGPEWTWLHPKVRELNKAKKPTKVFDVVVTMGGADPDRRTLQVMNRLMTFETPLKVAVITGPAFSHVSEIHSLSKTPSQIQWSILASGGHLHETLAQSKTAICAFGITASECFALKVPMLIVTHSTQSADEVDLMLKKHPTAGRRILPEQFEKEDLERPSSQPPATLGNLPENLLALLSKIRPLERV